MLRIYRWLMLVVLLVAPVRVMRGESVASLPAVPADHVDDYAGILSAGTVQNLNDLLTQLNLQAHARVQVVTLKSLDADKPGLPAPSIEEFATALEDKWKVGEKGTDRGLLVIVSLNPRKYRIEVGYGLEGILPDGKVGDIGREMQPYLHTGNYDQALTVGAQELAQDIATDAGVTLNTSVAGETPAPPQYTSEPQQQGSPLPILIFAGIIVVVVGILIATGHVGLLFFILFNLLGGGRGGGGGFGGGGGGFGGGGGDSGVGFGGGSGGGGASGDF